jgi:hypothetical protein
VDFNRRRHAAESIWKPLELGVLQKPVAHYMNHHSPHPLPAEKWKSLSEKWELIRQIRNDVCHPYSVTQDRAKVIREALRELDEQAVFQELGSLKARLRGQVSSDDVDIQNRQPEPSAAADRLPD